MDTGGKERATMKWRFLSALVMVLAVCALMQGGREARASDDAPGVLVVCSDSVKVIALPKNTLQDMYLGRKSRWDDGQKIELAVLKDSPATELFLRLYTGKTPQQFSIYWDKLAFTGKGSGPKAFPTPQALVDYVRNTPGAIGFIPLDLYTGQIKSISID
jgi:ABC-type phosphate transport system substrate-binding protein